MTEVVTYRIRLDGKRRPTLPGALLRLANLEGTRELIAHAEGVGRIVLEDPAVALAEFQAVVAAGTRATGFGGDLAEDLLEDRRRDTTL